MQIQGYYDLRFEAVREAFAALFDNPGERGAALCVQVAGETVVDLWAGPADKDGQEMWREDTLLNLFSCTKTFAAVAVLQLVGEGKLELELVPQGNLAERIRAAGAGIGGFFTPTSYGTQLAEGKETREIGGRMHVLEFPIHADYALIKAERGDRWGNLTYRMTARNFGPIMAMAARTTIATVHELVPLGTLDPEAVVTPGLFVKRVVQVARTATVGAGFKTA